MSQFVSSWDLPNAVDSDQLEKFRSTLHEIDPLDSRVSCVDGRQTKTEDVFAQLLGGSLNIVSVVWFSRWLDDDQISHEQAIDTTIKTLKKAGLPIGLHTGPHGDFEAGVTDCGFADKYQAIVETIANNSDEIKRLINNAGQQNGVGDLINDDNQDIWNKIIDVAKRLSTSSEQLSSQEVFEEIKSDIDDPKLITPLIGEHQEPFAHVNLADKTTIDTSKTNELGVPAFNLDAWYLKSVVSHQEFKNLGIDLDFSLLLTLGLYQATERVLRSSRSPLSIAITMKQ